MPKTDSGSVKLATFGGVFTPSILTIFGLILFLRIGFVVGHGADSGTTSHLWYGRLLAGAARLKHNVIVLDTDETAWVRLAEIKAGDRRIDVWWFDAESSRMMYLLAHLMTRTEEWEDATVRILVPASEDSAERARGALEKHLDEVRIDAAVEAVTDVSIEAVVEHSRDAALVYIPLRIEGMQLSEAFGWGVAPVLARLPIVALVAAAEDVPLSEESEDVATRVAVSPADAAG
jgi:hypothetical protein